MQIHKATIADVDTIHSLISSHAERDKMLFCSKADIYENLQRFNVAKIDARVVGCCALQIIWLDLAEVKSLAIDTPLFGRGIGKELVCAAIRDAKALGSKKIFTLTMEPVFFEKLGFKRTDKKALPMKVWSDCAKCPKQDHCDEIALILPL